MEPTYNTFAINDIVKQMDLVSELSPIGQISFAKDNPIWVLNALFSLLSTYKKHIANGGN